MGRSVMPSDVSVKAVGPVLGTSENPAGPNAEKSTSPVQAQPSAPPVLVISPSLRFDPASGLVVIEFHDQSGNVTRSIPTLQQLEAYRIWGRPSENPAVSGATGSANDKNTQAAAAPASTASTTTLAATVQVPAATQAPTATQVPATNAVATGVHLSATGDG
jgi:hypothetical protein